MTTMKINTEPPQATYSGAGSTPKVGNECFVAVPSAAASGQLSSQGDASTGLLGPFALLARLWSGKQADREAGG
jgi:hypothetical protein